VPLQESALKRHTPQHPKTLELCRLLNISLAQAVGHLELLWHFTAQYAPQGNIGRFTNQWIESACDWQGKPGVLIDAFRRAGWVDDHANDEIRLVVHNWHLHADDAVRKRLARGHEAFLSVTGKVTGKRQTKRRTSSTTQDGSVCLPEPEPEPEPLPEPQPLPQQSDSESRIASSGDDAAAAHKKNANGNGTHFPAVRAAVFRLSTRWPVGEDLVVKVIKAGLEGRSGSTDSDIAANVDLAIQRNGERMKGPGLLPTLVKEQLANRRRIEEQEKAECR
jgi:hypothetical protein